jgi:hypothetical protein
MNFFACLKITLLLAITFLILVSLPSYEDTLGQIYSILVAFYRLRESIAIEYK